ncbi:hypothetical protein H7849_01855 [Alloacidobacterium dinghuense]|uniref:Uncharacterized protein n=1 Tax=Alloacidobacterium dinghuense TaxID=2763107 RepID=A0A7G8BRQ3_9BACT|nr:hypothetical protein [Alloacidobacterium dinghuense]QNI35223.1 hypothetical protein H7849_01855 [Alloacidobacterium dinghuense]
MASAVSNQAHASVRTIFSHDEIGVSWDQIVKYGWQRLQQMFRAGKLAQMPNKAQKDVIVLDL